MKIQLCVILFCLTMGTNPQVVTQRVVTQQFVTNPQVVTQRVVTQQFVTNPQLDFVGVTYTEITDVTICEPGLQECTLNENNKITSFRKCKCPPAQHSIDTYSANPGSYCFDGKPYSIENNAYCKCDETQIYDPTSSPVVRLYEEYDTTGDKMTIRTNGIPNHDYLQYNDNDIRTPYHICPKEQVIQFDKISCKGSCRDTNKIGTEPSVPYSITTTGPIGILKTGAYVYGGKQVNNHDTDTVGGNVWNQCQYYYRSKPKTAYRGCEQVGWMFDGYPIYENCRVRENSETEYCENENLKTQEECLAVQNFREGACVLQVQHLKDRYNWFDFYNNPTFDCPGIPRLSFAYGRSDCYNKKPTFAYTGVDGDSSLPIGKCTIHGKTFYDVPESECMEIRPYAWQDKNFKSSAGFEDEYLSGQDFVCDSDSENWQYFNSPVPPNGRNRFEWKKSSLKYTKNVRNFYGFIRDADDTLKYVGSAYILTPDTIFTHTIGTLNPVHTCNKMQYFNMTSGKCEDVGSCDHGELTASTWNSPKTCKSPPGPPDLRSSSSSNQCSATKITNLETSVVSPTNAFYSVDAVADTETIFHHLQEFLEPQNPAKVTSFYIGHFKWPIDFQSELPKSWPHMKAVVMTTHVWVDSPNIRTFYTEYDRNWYLNENADGMYLNLDDGTQFNSKRSVSYGQEQTLRYDDFNSDKTVVIQLDGKNIGNVVVHKKPDWYDPSLRSVRPNVQNEQVLFATLPTYELFPGETFKIYFYRKGDALDKWVSVIKYNSNIAFVSDSIHMKDYTKVKKYETDDVIQLEATRKAASDSSGYLFRLEFRVDDNAPEGDIELEALFNAYDSEHKDTWKKTTNALKFRWYDYRDSVQDIPKIKVRHRQVKGVLPYMSMSGTLHNFFDTQLGSKQMQGLFVYEDKPSTVKNITCDQKDDSIHKVSSDCTVTPNSTYEWSHPRVRIPLYGSNDVNASVFVETPVLSINVTFDEIKTIGNSVGTQCEVDGSIQYQRLPIRVYSGRIDVTNRFKTQLSSSDTNIFEIKMIGNQPVVIAKITGTANIVLDDMVKEIRVTNNIANITNIQHNFVTTVVRATETTGFNVNVQKNALSKTTPYGYLFSRAIYEDGRTEIVLASEMNVSTNKFDVSIENQTYKISRKYISRSPCESIDVEYNRCKTFTEDINITLKKEKIEPSVVFDVQNTYISKSNSLAAELWEIPTTVPLSAKLCGSDGCVVEPDIEFSTDCGEISNNILNVSSCSTTYPKVTATYEYQEIEAESSITEKKTAYDSQTFTIVLVNRIEPQMFYLSYENGNKPGVSTNQLYKNPCATNAGTNYSGTFQPGFVQTTVESSEPSIYSAKTLGEDFITVVVPSATGTFTISSTDVQSSYKQYTDVTATFYDFEYSVVDIDEINKVYVSWIVPEFYIDQSPFASDVKVEFLDSTDTIKYHVQANALELGDIITFETHDYRKKSLLWSRTSFSSFQSGIVINGPLSNDYDYKTMFVASSKCSNITQVSYAQTRPIKAVTPKNFAVSVWPDEAERNFIYRSLTDEQRTLVDQSLDGNKIPYLFFQYAITDKYPSSFTAQIDIKMDDLRRHLEDFTDGTFNQLTTSNVEFVDLTDANYDVVYSLTGHNDNIEVSFSGSIRQAFSRDEPLLWTSGMLVVDVSSLNRAAAADLNDYIESVKNWESMNINLEFETNKAVDNNDAIQIDSSIATENNILQSIRALNYESQNNLKNNLQKNVNEYFTRHGVTTVETQNDASVKLKNMRRKPMETKTYGNTIRNQIIQEFKRPTKNLTVFEQQISNGEVVAINKPNCTVRGDLNGDCKFDIHDLNEVSNVVQSFNDKSEWIQKQANPTKDKNNIQDEAIDNIDLLKLEQIILAKNPLARFLENPTINYGPIDARISVELYTANETATDTNTDVYFEIKTDPQTYISVGQKITRYDKTNSDGSTTTGDIATDTLFVKAVTDGSGIWSVILSPPTNYEGSLAYEVAIAVETKDTNGHISARHEYLGLSAFPYNAKFLPLLGNSIKSCYQPPEPSEIEYSATSNSCTVAKSITVKEADEQKVIDRLKNAQPETRDVRAANAQAANAPTANTRRLAAKEREDEIEQDIRNFESDFSDRLEARKALTENARKAETKQDRKISFANFDFKAIRDRESEKTTPTEKRTARIEIKQLRESVLQLAADQLKIAKTCNNDGDATFTIEREESGVSERLRLKIKSRDVEYVEIKLPKKEYTGNEQPSTTDCSDADVELGQLKREDFVECWLEKQGDLCLKCLNGQPVSYIKLSTLNNNDLDQYTPYCLVNGAWVPKSGTFEEDDTYTCSATGQYEHEILSSGDGFAGCDNITLPNNGAIGNCASTGCSHNETVTCLYNQQSCQPTCVAGYKSDGSPLTCDGNNQFTSQTTCSECDNGKYKHGTNGAQNCHNPGENAAIRYKNLTSVKCATGFSGTPQYDGNGKYESGCIVTSGEKPYMYGVVKAKNDNGECVSQCARWTNQLLDNFNSTGVELWGDGTLYCTYLLWTSNPIKSSDC